MRCEIRFEPSKRSITMRPGEMTLLEATRRAGLPIASSCSEQGACGRCGLRVLDGAGTLEAESAREQRIKARNRIDSELRLACRIRPRRDLTVRAAYW